MFAVEGDRPMQIKTEIKCIFKAWACLIQTCNKPKNGHV